LGTCIYFYFGFLSQADETLACLCRCCHVSLTIFTGHTVRSTRSQARRVTSCETVLFLFSFLTRRPFDVTVTTPPPPSRQRWRLPVLQSNDDGQPRGFELPRPSMATDTCPQHLDTFAGPWRESLRPSFAEVFGRCGGINTGGINTMYRSGSDYT
ncbi:hypothetical protein EDB89DRAFT_1969309, partial [Lactarius sanguifluus]